LEQVFYSIAKSTITISIIDRIELEGKDVVEKEKRKEVERS